MRINANGALYDNEVKEIRLFNYRILTEDISLEGRDKVWWLADRLVDHGKYYTLEIDLQDFDAYPEEFTFKKNSNEQKLTDNRCTFANSYLDSAPFGYSLAEKNQLLFIKSWFFFIQAAGLVYHLRRAYASFTPQHPQISVPA